MAITLIPVEGSTNIAARGYDDTSRELAVIFKSGKHRYDYHDVPPEIWQAWLDADSPGKFHRTNIATAFAFDATPLSVDEDHIQSGA